MPERRPAGWLTVARWELKRVLRRGDFIVSILLTPILIFVVSTGNRWMEKRGRDRVHRVALVRGGAHPTAESLATVRWEPVTGATAHRDTLVSGVLAKRWDAALLVPADFAAGGKSELVVRRELPGLKRTIDAFLHAEARRIRAAGYGLDTAALARLDTKTTSDFVVADPQARSGRTDRIVALVLMLLVMTVIFGTISYVMVGISGEKQSRVTEVVVSAISPQAWMDGKIVAYTIVGLVSGVVWSIGGVWMLTMFASQLPDALNPGAVALFLAYGILGLALYVCFFAALMATLKDFQSASKLQGNFILIPFLPVFFLQPILDSPEAGFAIVTSLIPFFAPMLMPMRIALGQAPTWQIALGLVLLAGSVWLMRRFAGTAFRVGMLMYGKDLNLPELLKLAKH